MKNYDLVVVGGGPAGLAAAIEAFDNGVKDILVIERDRELGGILNQCIHNGFGLQIFKEELTGPEYAERFIDGVIDRGINYRLDTMVLDITDEKVVTIMSESKGIEVISSKSVILAMGCRERTRGAISIAGSRPAGVFSAGTAQRYINMEGYMVGKKVLILGSGDIGLIMARRMTLEGADVLGVVELMPFSGGLTRNIVQCLDDYNIPLLLSHTVTEIKGTDRITGVEVSKVDKDRNIIEGTQIHYDCDTLLLSVGLIPENELSSNLGLNIDKKTSGPVVNEYMETSVEGIFACGNVVHVHDLVDFVTLESMNAGKSAAMYINNLMDIQNSYSVDTVPGSGVSYIVPHSFNVKNKDIKLSFRVKDVYRGSSIVIKAGGSEIIRKVKRHMAPGEMESIIIPSDIINQVESDILTIEIV